MKHLISSILLGGILALMFMHTPAQGQVVVPGVMGSLGGVPENPAALHWARTSSIGAVYGKGSGTFEFIGLDNSDFDFSFTGLQGQMIGDTFSIGFGQNTFKMSLSDPIISMDVQEKTLLVAGSMLITENLSLGVGLDDTDSTESYRDFTGGGEDTTDEEKITLGGGTFQLGDNLYLGVAVGEENLVSKVDQYTSGALAGSTSFDATRGVQMMGIAYSNVRGQDSGLHLEISLDSGKPYEFTDGSSADEYKDNRVTLEVLYSNYFVGVDITNGTSTDYDPGTATTKTSDSKETVVGFGYAPMDGFGIALINFSNTIEESENGMATTNISMKGNVLSGYMNF